MYEKFTNAADNTLIFFLFVFSEKKNRLDMKCLVLQRLKLAGYSIKKTYLYNFNPLKPNFNRVKLGFTGVYIIFLISAQNIDCGYTLEPPRGGGSNEYPQSMF